MYKQGAQTIISAYAQALSPIFRGAAALGQKVSEKVDEAAAQGKKE